MSKYKYFDFHIEGEDDEFGFLFFKDPNKNGNFINMEMMRELIGFFKDPPESIERLLIADANGGDFSRGADVDEHLTPTVNEMIPLFGELVKLVYNFRTSFGISTMAAVSGWCLGGGLELARCFSEVIAWFPDTDKKVGLGLPEITINCFPPVAFALFPYIGLDIDMTIRFMLTGKILKLARKDKSGDAWRMGLVDGSFTGNLDELKAEFMGWGEIHELDDHNPNSYTQANIWKALEEAETNGLDQKVLSVAVDVLAECSDESFVPTLNRASELYLNELVPLPQYKKGLEAAKLMIEKARDKKAAK